MRAGVGVPAGSLTGQTGEKANPYGGISRSDFPAKMRGGGIGLAGFAVAATPVAGQVITTPSTGISVADGKVPAGDSRVPVYEARPAAAGRYPVVLVIPEVFGMHEHIKDVTCRFTMAGFLAITYEPYAREGGVLNRLDIDAVRKVVDPIPDGHGLRREEPGCAGRSNRRHGVLPRRVEHASFRRPQSGGEGRHCVVRPDSTRTDARRMYRRTARCSGEDRCPCPGPLRRGVTWESPWRMRRRWRRPSRQPAGRPSL